MTLLPPTKVQFCGRWWAVCPWARDSGKLQSATLVKVSEAEALALGVPVFVRVGIGWQELDVIVEVS